MLRFFWWAVSPIFAPWNAFQLINVMCALMILLRACIGSELFHRPINVFEYFNIISLSDDNGCILWKSLTEKKLNFFFFFLIFRKQFSFLMGFCSRTKMLLDSEHPPHLQVYHHFQMIHHFALQLKSLSLPLFLYLHLGSASNLYGVSLLSFEAFASSMVL